jgi:hypothetical protein
MANVTAAEAKSAKMRDTEIDTPPDSLPNAGTTMSNAQQEISKLDAVKHCLDRLHPHAKLAHPHIFVLLSSIGFLVTTLMVLSTVLNGVSRHLESRLDVARTEGVALMDTNLREGILYGQLEKVLGTQLNNSFTESYEDCLVRGLQMADQQLFGLVYHNWDVLHQTFDWTLVNCGRLHHSPQLPQPPVQQAVLTRWALTSYRARRIAEKTLTLITHQMRSFNTRLSRHTGIHILEAPKPAQSETPQCCCIPPPRYTDRILPFGFILKCDQSSSCHLEYTPSVHEPNQKTEVSPEHIAKRLRKVSELRKVYDHIRLMQIFMPWVIIPLFALQSYSLFISTSVFLILTILSPVDKPKGPLREAMRRSLKETLPLMFFTVVQVVLVEGCEDQLKLGTHGREKIMTALLMAIAIALSAISAAVTIHDPSPIYNAFKSLLQVSRDALVDFRDPEKNPYTIVKDKVFLKPTSPASSAKPLSPLASPLEVATSSPADEARPLSPLAVALIVAQTNTQGKSQAPLSQYHSYTVYYESETEPENKTDDESDNQAPAGPEVELDTETEPEPEPRTESESEPESEHETDTVDYVDLASGITPTTTDDPDWAVVDA